MTGAPDLAGGTGGGGGDMASSTTTGGTTAGTTGGTTGGVADMATPISTTAVKFVAMGDTGKGNADQKMVGDAIAAWCAQKGCDFVQLLGDNIYDSGADSATDPQFQTKFETPYAAVNLPFWVVLGNHDYGGNGAGYEFSKGKNEVDYTMKSTKWKLPSATWHRTASNVEFFGLDSNMQMYGQDSAQKTDVKSWIAASTSKWKIALGHHPYLSNGPHGNAGSYDGLSFVPVTNGAGVKSFMEEVVCGKVDLYLSGHDHSRQWLKGKCSGTELIVSGAGASGTELPGSNETWFQSIELGFLYVVIDGGTLTGQFVDSTGKVEITRTLTK